MKILPYSIALAGLFFVTNTRALEFTVMINNVENLMDIDGVNFYDDYKELTPLPHPYSPRKLRTKLENLAFIFKQINNGEGPEIALLCEIETDKTPPATATNYSELLQKYASTTYKKMLDYDRNADVPEDIRDLPATFWLVKALADEGMRGYNVSYAARTRSIQETGNVHNVTLSKFPITARRSLPAPAARDILEVHHNIDGYTFITFNNHWKSGAGSYSFENDRAGAAALLRHRVLEILDENPHADILLGGDFNAYYNQSTYLNDSSTRNRTENSSLRVPHSSINDVLGAQGFEKKTAETGNPVFYNLWAELPLEERKSDEYNGIWGTLMQIMITRGLYDHNGVQYIDNSFSTLILQQNSDRVGRPRRWTFYGKNGGGFSDHFPLIARFRIVPDNDTSRLIDLVSVRPSNEDLSSSPLNRVKYPAVDFRTVPHIRTILDDEAKVITSMGELFRVSGSVLYKNPVLLNIGPQVPLSVFARGTTLTAWLYSLSIGQEVEFVGELNEYNGNLQMVLFTDRAIVTPPIPQISLNEASTD